MTKILLVTPPLLQPNAPYPATPYLTGFLRREGYEVEQLDLSIELLNSVFTGEFLSKVFAHYTDSEHGNIQRIQMLRERYIDTIDTVMSFLRGEDMSLANLICSADFLPQSARFEQIEDLETAYGSMGNIDCAKYLSTLYLTDISDFIQEVITPHFSIVKYGETLSMSVVSFALIKNELAKPKNIIEQEMLRIFSEKITQFSPSFVGFSIPFPGNLLAAMRCAEYIREQHSDIKIVVGGGYPTTELRSMTDKKIFQYVDYVILDDGEISLKNILEGKAPQKTYFWEDDAIRFFDETEQKLSHKDRGCPDFDGLPHKKYFSLTDGVNPMHRLWGDGRWNKIMVAHGCYWAKCAFCDTKLDYICNYDSVDAVTIVDWIEQIIVQTGSRGFHFVDEAAPPKLLKEIALEILRRKLKVSWWGNIRFEKQYTADLCQLLAASGCIAVSGGVEVASDRLLTLMNKGVTIEQLTIAMRNFYYAGIMVHSYLMYGFPTQTLQETVDSLEVVRQLFQAELISSAFWHRYAMTVHSPSGNEPEKFNVKRRNDSVNPFANNEIAFLENRNYSLERTGDALRKATYNFMRQSGIDKPVHKWFEGKTPQTEIDIALITDHIIKPDSSRIFDETARLVWIGVKPERVPEGLFFVSNSGSKSLKMNDNESEFMLEIIELCSDLSRKVTFAEVKSIFAKHSEEPFLFLYHAKKWDIMRSYGLLQV